jgi:hypothetical protein
MNHFMDFDPYPVGERNQMMQPEINSLRPRERPRKTATTSREMATCTWSGDDHPWSSVARKDPIFLEVFRI